MTKLQIPRIPDFS